jgi:EAL domain-containing protein (putative c-di-GMP-specific phosphodiesterase class I)
MLEIPQSSSLDGHADAWSDLTRLHESGVRIALDDFGGGSVSLNYLRHRAVDAVMLDPSFVQDRDDQRLRTVLAAIADLTDRLDVTVIAQGIDDEASRDFALSAGFRFGRGRMFGLSAPAQDA